MNNYKLLIFLLLALIFKSCTIERNLAVEAGKRINKSSILVLFPDEIIKTNSKPYSFANNLNEEEKYWQAIDSSDFLKYINDTIVQKKFHNSIIKLYAEYGFIVYENDDLTSFLQTKNPAFIIDFSQLELEEYWKYFYAKEQMPDEKEYKQSFSLNALALNAWVRVSVVNDSTLPPKLVFSQYYSSDQIDGYFYQNEITGEVNYRYNLIPFDTNLFEDFFANSSIKISLDIIDFVANSYIENRLLQKIEEYPTRFWRYKPNNQKLTPTKNNSGYIILNEK
ncbi:MAG: hypothetical protein AUJ98_03955 [Bacteroidetes bacterium CG2_30_33_31]|nr:MAG: hypothetical protein AUJ98_03955 [Bacteroidetes bacterium CG2_30_33_31]